MGTTNYAYWTRTPSGWSIIVEFRRHWEVKVGAGKGDVLTVPLHRRDDHRPQQTKVKLTSNVFSRQGVLKAFAEEV